MRIGYQGMPGAYSEEALLSFLLNAEAAPKRTLQHVFAALDSGEIDRAFVPVENSHAGSVVETYDLMLDHAVTVTAEQIHQVHHCLLGLPGSDLSQVKRVFSHPQALAQTDAFLQRLDLEIEPFYDTAGAAEMVAARKDPRCAAVASQLAGHRYGLEILASNIETSADNATRFFLLAPGAWTEHRTVRGEGAGKTSLVFAVEHQPGALVRTLSSFSGRHVNLARLESRPSRTKSWEYLFFTDANGYTDDPQLHAALEDLDHLSSLVRVLGSYPAAALAEGEGTTTER
jgi:prephenate dehydratase